MLPESTPRPACHHSRTPNHPACWQRVRRPSVDEPGRPLGCGTRWHRELALKQAEMINRSDVITLAGPSRTERHFGAWSVAFEF